MILIIISFNLVVDYSIKIYKIFFVKNLSGQLALKRALLTTDEAVKKEIMKNTSILRSELKKEDFNIYCKSNNSYNGNIDNTLLEKNKSNESSLIENSQIKMYKRETVFSPIYQLNKKTRNKILVENIISKINSSIISNNSNHGNSINSLDKEINNKNNINNEMSSRKGIIYNGSFKGSKNNNIYPEYTIKVNNNSLDNKNSNKNIMNPFNNYLLYKNSNKFSSKKSAFFGNEKFSNYRKSFSNNINNEGSENNININIVKDKSEYSINDMNDGSSQDFNNYNIKKKNNNYLFLK